VILFAARVLARVRIRADTFGDHRRLMVSPQHRVLIRDSLAGLLFGEAEVLVAAKDLVNDLSIRICAGGDVDHVHILFDRHRPAVRRTPDRPEAQVLLAAGRAA
jgi:Hint domain